MDERFGSREAADDVRAIETTYGLYLPLEVSSYKGLTKPQQEFPRLFRRWDELQQAIDYCRL